MVGPLKSSAFITGIFSTNLFLGNTVLGLDLIDNGTSVLPFFTMTTPLRLWLASVLGIILIGEGPVGCMAIPGGSCFNRSSPDTLLCNWQHIWHCLEDICYHNFHSKITAEIPQDRYTVYFAWLHLDHLKAQLISFRFLNFWLLKFLNRNGRHLRKGIRRNFWESCTPIRTSEIDFTKNYEGSENQTCWIFGWRFMWDCQMVRILNGIWKLDFTAI